MANNVGWSVGVFFLLLIFAEFSGADSLTASNYTNSSASESPTSIPAKNDTQRCLKTLNEIEGVLSSKVPPLKEWITDNYRNISRALFPALNLPSLYIKITLQFINETGNQKTLLDEVKKFTWSESYVFVSVKQTCLAAMSAFSLGTVLPQRRQTELVLTVPPLCDGASRRNGFEDDNEMWRYVLLTLQDIAINPNLSDPRLNTAQYVVLGHEGDADQSIDYPASVADWYNFKSCWILPVSFLFTIAISWYAYTFWAKEVNEEAPTCSALLKTFTVSTFFFFILSLASSLLELIIVCHNHCCQYSIYIHFSFIILSFIPRLIIKWRIKPPVSINEDRKFHVWASGVMFPCIYQIVHHLLWVLCAGIPADPSWAVPLFLCECLAILTPVCAIYMYNKDNARDGKLQVGCHLAICVVAIWLGIFTVVISFYSRSTAVSTENFLEIIMAAVLLFVLKNSGLWNNGGTTATANPPPQNPPPERDGNEQIPLVDRNVGANGHG